MKFVKPLLFNRKSRTFFLLLISQLSFYSLAKASNESSSERPNVIIIVSDDQYEFGFESGRATTPHIDKICEEGMWFQRAYTTSVCTATRYNIMSGKYSSSDESEGARKLFLEDGTRNVQWTGSLHINDTPHNMANTFQRSGYYTGHVGKIHNSIKSPDPEVDRARFTSVKAIVQDAPLTDANNNALLKTHQKALQETMSSVGYDYAAAVVSANLGNEGWEKLGVHNMEWMTKGAVDFLDSAKTKDEPFFLYLATTLAHGPHDLRNSLDDDPRKTPAGYLDAPISGYQPSREDVIARAAKISDGKYGSTMWLDDGVGAIMHKLKDIGADENTIVVFMTDHAVNGGKASCFEGGVNPPVVFRWKKGISPSVTQSLIHTVDFLPTFIELCDLDSENKEELEGKDISSILSNNEAKVRDAVMTEFGVSRAVANDRYKYIAIRYPEYIVTREKHEANVAEFRQYVKDRNLNVNELLDNPAYADLIWPNDHNCRLEYNKPTGTGKQAARAHFGTLFDWDQLYDLEKDPNEQNNLANDPAYKAILDQMKVLLKEELKERPGVFGEFDTYDFSTEKRFKNIAEGKETTQSSTHYADKGYAAVAVDGETDDVKGGYTFQCTKKEKWSWWQLDLGKVEHIDRINIWNRVDASNRLRNFILFVSKDSLPTANPYDYLYRDDIFSYSMNFECGHPSSVDVGDSGRYIRVQLWDTEMLHMTELEVLQNTFSFTSPLQIPSYEVDAMDTLWLDGDLWKSMTNTLDFKWAIDDSSYVIEQDDEGQCFIATNLSHSGDVSTVNLKISVDTSVYEYDMPMKVKPVQASLVAIAGRDTSLMEGDTLFLDASSSYAQGKLSITNYKWSFAGKEENSKQIEFIASEVSSDSTIILTLNVASDALWSAPDSICITVKDQPSRINNIQSLNLKVYPNPLGQVKALNVDWQASDKAILSIYNLSGKKLAEATIHKGSQKVELPELSKGVYILSMASEEVIFSEKLIVE